MIKQLTVQQLKAWLDGADENPVVVDVREPWEVATCCFPGSTHIPMREIPLRLPELPRDKDLVVHCHHGTRGEQVAYFLQQQGYEKLYNLQGGIDAWAREIDPNMPTY